MSNLIPGVAVIKAGKKAAKKLPKKKKMRQPTAAELKKGRASFNMVTGGRSYLTKGNKPGEMVYSKPSTEKNAYVQSGPNKGVRKQKQITSDVEGGRGKINPPRVKPTASKGQIHSAANKEKIDKAARAANKRSAAANRDTIKKNETIGQQRKRKKENQDIDKGIKTIALRHGSAGKGGTHPPTKPELESEFLNSLKPKKNPPKPKSETKTKIKKKMGGGYMKKNMKVGGSLEMVKKNGKEVPFYAADGVGKMAKGGKVSKAMGGGKVYKYGHGGGLGKTKVKRISKNETNGNKIVDDCYKNYV